MIIKCMFFLSCNKSAISLPYTEREEGNQIGYKEDCL